MNLIKSWTYLEFRVMRFYFESFYSDCCLMSLFYHILLIYFYLILYFNANLNRNFNQF
jgi:hypothetical protein